MFVVCNINGGFTNPICKTKQRNKMNFDLKTSLILLLIVFCFSCNSEPIELSNHDWKVTDLKGSAATKKDLSKLSLIFKEDKKISGFAGCNNYRGGATYNQEQIKFSTLYSDNSSCTMNLNNGFYLTLSPANNTHTTQEI